MGHFTSERSLCSAWACRPMRCSRGHTKAPLLPPLLQPSCLGQRGFKAFPVCSLAQEAVSPLPHLPGCPAACLPPFCACLTSPRSFKWVRATRTYLTVIHPQSSRSQSRTLTTHKPAAVLRLPGVLLSGSPLGFLLHETGVLAICAVFGFFPSFAGCPVFVKQS